tara:strand:+ start:2535 stop:2954 length:420 start_codon:yes stop_codon:yes gene_type:complete
MGYAIELSTDDRKARMVIINETTRRQEAEKYMCEMQYFTHEVEIKKRKISKMNMTQVVIFSKKNFESMLKYIQEIRKNRQIYIECIYRDDSSSDLLYASPKYLKNLDKNFVKSYKKQINNKIRKDDELEIYEALNKNRY